jgi:hypothetical protein
MGACMYGCYLYRIDTVGSLWESLLFDLVASEYIPMRRKSNKKDSGKTLGMRNRLQVIFCSPYTTAELHHHVKWISKYSMSFYCLSYEMIG